MTNVRRPRAVRALAAIVLSVMCSTSGVAALPLLDKVDDAVQQLLENPLLGTSKVRVILSA